MERFTAIENRIRKIERSENGFYVRLKYSNETFFISLDLEEESKIYFDEKGFTVISNSRIQNLQYEDILEIF